VTELPTAKVLTLDVAKRIAAAARTYARRKGFPNLIVAIVDPGGHLIYLERGDGVGWGTIDVAVLKAQTVTRFNVESKVLEDGVAQGLTGLVGLPGVAAFEGAVPIRAEDGQLLGAIAISGLTKELDGEIARAGADALPAIVKRSGRARPRR
jgi:glc operon protein GlcG